jgi:hypothetical protein
MDEKTLTDMVNEMREDFQLPPYLADAVIKRAVQECCLRLSSLNPGSDLTEGTGKMLLKNATYYNIQHRYEEFEGDYATVLHGWMLSEVSK